MINFIVTEDSLYEKLLVEVLELELPDEEKLRKDLKELLYEDRQLL